MNLQDAAVSFVEPRHHNQLGAGRDPMERRRECRIDLEGRFRRTSEGLIRRISAVVQVLDRTILIGATSISIAMPLYSHHLRGSGPTRRRGSPTVVWGELRPRVDVGTVARQ